MSRVSRTTLAVVGALALVTGTAATAAGAPGEGARHEVSEAPAWTAHAPTVNRLAVPAAVHAKVWLTPRDAAALTKLAVAVSDPSSASYGHYLSAGQYRARFAPSAATVAAVRNWAKSAGLAVDGVGPSNHYVAVSGSAGAMSAAFTAALKTFSVNGHTGTAPTTPVTVPDSLGGAVAAVTGLDTVTHWAHPASDRGTGDTPGASPSADLGPAPGYVNASPCSAYYGQKVDRADPAFEGRRLPYVVCGYVPSQLRSVYGVTASRRTGAGSTIAITDAFASPTIESDANTYARRQGDRPFAPGQFSQHNDTNYDPQRVEDCGGNGWYGEETLDVEAAHGMAPRASVAYYGAASCYDDDLLAALARIVTDDTASVVSNSWGEATYVMVDGVAYPTLDDSLISAYNTVFVQGAVQGIGFYFSSGDSGDELANTGVKAPDWPAANFWVTAVGGTALAVTRSGRRAFETGWGTEMYSLAGQTWSPVGFLYGAGGGCSDIVRKPFYQFGSRTACPTRAVPDIAMAADPQTGMLIGQTQVFAGPTVWGEGTQYGEFRIGGTSLAAPLFAGLQADRQVHGRRVGFANPLIYLFHHVPGMFFDVTPQGDPGNVRVNYVNGLNDSAGLSVSVRTFDQDSSLRTGRGWDEVTGVGTPTARYILSGR